MRITFLGAAHEVTGSCTYVECGKTRFIVDCGMEQGRDMFENQSLPILPSQVDFALLTHAHIDHSGLLPLLAKNGFTGSVYATAATCSLADIMLRDSAHIQMSEAEYKTRKAQRAGGAAVEPLYDTEDVAALTKNLRPCSYGEVIQVAEGVAVRFTDVGHLLGSACIEVWLSEGGERRKIVFSGDVGNLHQPILRDPQLVSGADYVVVESTYGARLHTGGQPDYIGELTKVIQRTLDRGGNVVIPSFAVGRTQEMLYFIREIKERRLVQGYGNFPVYVDSPLAVEATNIFKEHEAECYDSAAAELLAQGINPIQFPGLKLSITSDESKAINLHEEPKVIISASGMCDAGRIKHHLKHNLWRKECTILFVGYQAAGTLGRHLLSGAEDAKILGEDVHVNAKICQLPGVSGHADNEGLMRWAGNFKVRPEQVFVTHGEDKVTELFAARLRNELGYPADAPFSGTVYDLAHGVYLERTRGIPYEKKVTSTSIRGTGNSVFDRLLAAGQRLLAVIQRNKGGANKDLSKFADQINSLCDKWDR